MSNVHAARYLAPITLGSTAVPLVACGDDAPAENDAFQSITIERTDDHVTIAWYLAGERACLGRQANELVAALVTKIGREIVAGGLALREVRFAHAAPDDVQPLVAYFGTERLVFDAGVNALVVDASVLHACVATADAVLEREAQVRSPSIDELKPVREKIRELLPQGEPSLSRVAPALGMSTRTLQRRLAEKGVTFRDLVGVVRRALAETYLGARARPPVSEVAERLGYADVRTFARAYRRWTGRAPGATRRL